VRKHDVIFLPPGVEHAISNAGLVDLVFLVVTSPVKDDQAAPTLRLAKLPSREAGLAFATEMRLDSFQRDEEGGYR
jgi:oxalate decarboxylase/phosphoglucose isomerase-like protein (cupin superfamily)